LLRLVWVILLLTFRSTTKTSVAETTEGEIEEIFDADVAPPKYTDDEKAVRALDDKDAKELA
jgi:hypothetical protein